MIRDDFEIAGGSVTGRAHTLIGKTNQDACTWFRSDDCLIALVADGCGSGKRSEVGAELGARLLAWHLASALPAQLAAGGALDAPALWEAARHALLAELDRLVKAMGGPRAEVVSEYFLFTLVGLCVAGEQACLFSAGDGLFALNGELCELGPFPRNEPPYLAYGLLDEAATSTPAPRFTIHRVLPARALDSVLLGTDGAGDLQRASARPLPGGGGEVGPLRQFWSDDAHFQNRDSIRRRLSLINREVVRPIWPERRLAKDRGLLEDDTTVVVVRRKRPSS
jgi:hypothetical protein